MSKFESQPNFRKATPVESPLDDFQDNPELLQLLKRLPAELQERHIAMIDSMDDEKSIEYITSILSKREEASRDSHVSDPALIDYFKSHDDEIWHSLETSVFTDEDNFIDAGTTAKIKRFDIGDAGMSRSLAIKYLVHPTPSTLKVDAEHDILKEVEQLERIERIEEERAKGVDSIKVPHPYFYFRKGKTQCYGMELIDGINLWEATTREYNTELKDSLREKFRNTDEAQLMKEVDAFFDIMHEICVHNDIKPRNIMVSNDGKFYVIDFGQSILSTSVDEKSAPAIEDRKEEEKEMAKKIIQNFLRSLKD